MSHWEVTSRYWYKFFICLLCIQMSHFKPLCMWLAQRKFFLNTLMVMISTSVHLAHHRARWMAKGIYCLKILLFREQFKMYAKELQALRRIWLFTITLYVKAWFTAPVTCDAPYNDLCMLQSMESFRSIDIQVAEVALHKMKAHLWYISEDLAELSLFSDKALADEKKQMVTDFVTFSQIRICRICRPVFCRIRIWLLTVADWILERSTAVRWQSDIDR